MSKRRPAVFLDRDGTLIEDAGVLSSPDQIRLLPDTIDALLNLQKDYLLFVVTNQPGIARAQVTAQQVAAVNHALDRILSEKGIRIQQWYVCPHTRNEGCQCIKPNTFFLSEAAKEYNLNLESSFMVGDHPHDVLTGHAVGVFGLYLLTGHGIKHIDEIEPDRLVFHTIGSAAAWILDHPHPEADLLRALRAGAEAIQRGGLVAFPTETVYGLGADAFNAMAVARIYEAKKRPLHNPLIVHIAEREQITSLVTGISAKAARLIDRFWPGPLTLVFPKSANVPDIVTAGHPTVAVRMPENPLARDFIRMSKTPIAAPSANAFGRTSATSAAHVREQLEGTYDALIDGGACRIGLESTVLSMVGEMPVLLRHGGVSKEDIEKVIGSVASLGALHVAPDQLQSPGMMPSHYATMTPLRIVDQVSHYSRRPDVGVIQFQNTGEVFAGPVAVLSPEGDMKEAAANLYHVMRRLDSLKLKMIVVERLPMAGLGAAINDRLEKAAVQDATENNIPPPLGGQ